MKVFKIVDETAELLKKRQNQYEKVEQNLVDFFVNVVGSNENFIGSTSRVKSEDSLKSKIVRKKYYLEYASGHEILDYLSDVVGITVECRFKEDEGKLFKLISNEFIIDDNEFSQSKSNPSIYLNLKMEQPQKQQNGYDDYRIDGYCYYNGNKVNFELQIKSLINTFWSGIEHEVIYKNNNYLLFDSFLTDILHTIKTNLDTIDYQLAKIYDQMTQIDAQGVGMDGSNFKSFLGKSINDLFSVKLIETIDIEADIKKVSALLSHYIYIEDFVRSEKPQIVMMSYFEKLNLLSNSEMDFTIPININEEVNNGDPFTLLFGQYCLDTMNVDFDWHVLFSMLFMLQNDDVVVTFNKFIKFIKELLFSPRWFTNQIQQIMHYSEFNRIDHKILEVVAKTLIKQKTIEVVYEENLYDVMVIIREDVEELVNISKEKYSDFDLIINKRLEKMSKKIDQVFNKQ